MEFVKLESVINEIDYCKNKALGSLEYIKADDEIEVMLKKCFEDIVKSLIDTNFDRLKNRIDSRVSHYEYIESFAERLKLSKDRLKRALEAGDIKIISIIDIK